MPPFKNVLQADPECSIFMEDTLINICEPTGSCSVPTEENNIVENPIPGWVSVSGAYFLWIVSWLLCASDFPSFQRHSLTLTGIWGRLVLCQMWGSQRPQWSIRQRNQCPLICPLQQCLLSWFFFCLYKAEVTAKPPLPNVAYNCSNSCFTWNRTLLFQTTEKKKTIKYSPKKWWYPMFLISKHFAKKYVVATRRLINISTVTALKHNCPWVSWLSPAQLSCCPFEKNELRSWHHMNQLQKVFFFFF